MGYQTRQQRQPRPRAGRGDGARDEQVSGLWFKNHVDEIVATGISGNVRPDDAFFWKSN